MSQTIIVGCDLHDRSMLLQCSVGLGQPRQATYENSRSGRRGMIRWLKDLAEKEGADRIVFAYEASGAGFGLCDQLHDEGIECHVLSATHLPKTPKSAKRKTDVRDALMILEVLRGYVYAGNALPVVWTPPQRLRDDRELVRARVDLAGELSRVKLQIGALIKRYELRIDCPTKTPWTKAFTRYVRQEVAPTLELTVRTKTCLLLDRLELLVSQRATLDQAIRQLSQCERYRDASRDLQQLAGVGLLVAMTFLTEMGDLTRFENRREVAAYLGLCPSSHESGERNDRKGRITRQGPARLRKMLCQAAWVSVSKCEHAAATFQKIRQGQKHRAKKALVALMRKLSIQMWHRALRYGVSEELLGRGGPHRLEQAWK